jgi:hypothetical protein
MMFRDLERASSETYLQGSHRQHCTIVKLSTSPPIPIFSIPCRHSLTEGDAEVKDKAPSEHLETMSAQNSGEFQFAT